MPIPSQVLRAVATVRLGKEKDRGQILQKGKRGEARKGEARKGEGGKGWGDILWGAVNFKSRS
ncbi:MULTISPECIES: hypothetical protein [unclassified Bartonella]|uniref:hypothetical protein n=1 Tax=unclassified Bartonella TaxID=2645622 RepID=UPI0035CE96AD